jgi:ABC-type sugar transport system substrate-binding protein
MCLLLVISVQAETVIVSLKSNTAYYWRLLEQGIKESAPDTWTIYWASPRYAQDTEGQRILLSGAPITPDAIILAPIEIDALSTELAAWNAAGTPVIFVGHAAHASATTALYHDDSAALTDIGNAHPSITHISLAAKPPKIPQGQASKFNKIQHLGKGTIPGNKPVFIDTHQVPADLFTILSARGKPAYMKNGSQRGFAALKIGTLAGILQRDQYAMGQKAVEALIKVFNTETVPASIAVPVEYITANNRVSQIKKIFRANVE